MGKLHDLLHTARISATPLVVVADRFTHALRKESADSALVFLGFIPPGKGEEPRFLERTGEWINGLPTTILVHSAGGMELEA